MAQRIEDKTVLVLDQSEFQAINRLLHGISRNPEAIAALRHVPGADILLDPRDREVLAGLWDSIHGMTPPKN